VLEHLVTLFPLTTDPMQLAAIQVQATYVGGERVWP